MQVADPTPRASSSNASQPRLYGGTDPASPTRRTATHRSEGAESEAGTGSQLSVRWKRRRLQSHVDTLRRSIPAGEDVDSEAHRPRTSEEQIVARRVRPVGRIGEVHIRDSTDEGHRPHT